MARVCPFLFSMLKRTLSWVETYFSLWKSIDIEDDKKSTAVFQTNCFISWYFFPLPWWKKDRKKRKLQTFGSSPIYIDFPAMQMFMPKWFSTWTDLQCPPVRIKSQYQRKEMLSNMCLFAKVVSIHSLPEVYLVMKIQIHNLIFYINFILRLTFEGEKIK